MADVQLDEIDAMCSIRVPVELREVLANSTDQVQPNRSTPETTFKSLPSHSPAQLRDKTLLKKEKPVPFVT